MFPGIVSQGTLQGFEDVCELTARELTHTEELSNVAAGLKPEGRNI